jgi:hypothetical protein
VEVLPVDVPHVVASLPAIGFVRQPQSGQYERSLRRVSGESGSRVERAQPFVGGIEARVRHGLEMVAGAGRIHDRPRFPSEELTGAGLPEVVAADLTAGIVANALERRAGVVVRGLLPSEAVSRLTGLLDDGASRITGRRGEWTAGNAAMVDAVADAHARSGVLALAAALMGEEPVGTVPRAFVKREDASLGGGLTWHQDASFYGRCGALSVWAALTHCGSTCPGLSLIPYRLETVLDPHYRLTGPSEPCIREAARLGREVGVSEPVLAPGDAILFDEMTLHRTSPRPWEASFRDVAITWFFAPSRFPTDYAPLAF